VAPRSPEELAVKAAKIPDKKDLPSMKEVGIEISNGNGVNQMASSEYFFDHHPIKFNETD
jgi:hypothetical protein